MKPEKLRFLHFSWIHLQYFLIKRIHRKIPGTLLHDVNDVSDDLDVVKIDKILLVECSFACTGFQTDNKLLLIDHGCSMRISRE